MELEPEPVDPAPEQVITGEVEGTETVDTDGDGTPDATDTEPNNPDVQ